MSDPLITGFEEKHEPIYQEDVIKLKIRLNEQSEEIARLLMLNEILVSENSILLGQTTLH